MPVLSETVLVRDESHQGLELSHEDSLVGSTNTVSTNSKVVNKLDKQSASLLKRSSSFAERDTTIDDLHQNDVVHEPIVALDLLWSWYLPLLMMWFRRSLFGTSYLIRSVLIGQCIRLLLTSATGSVDTTLPKWVILLTDPHAWPPPALTLLAIFTILALIVHPDGLTWFMLGKVRDCILSLLHSLSSCWTVFVHDFGIVTTTIAVGTLAGIGCVLSILLKNALPKSISRNHNYPICRTQASVQEKKKKKRKSGVKGKGGRLRPVRKPDCNVVKSIDEDLSNDLLTNANTRKMSRAEVMVPDKMVSPSMDVANRDEKGQFNAVMQPETIPMRQRVQSTSTIDTDGTNDSMSVLSTSSMQTVVSSCNSEVGKSIKARLRSNGSSTTASSGGSSSRRQPNSKPNALSIPRKVVTLESSQSQPACSRQSPSDPKSGTSLDLRHNGAVGVSPLGEKNQSTGTGRFAHVRSNDTRYDKPQREINSTSHSGQVRSMAFGECGIRSPSLRQSEYRFPPTAPTTSSLQTASPYPLQGTLPSQSNLYANQSYGFAVQYGSPYSPHGSQSTWKNGELSSFIGSVGIVGEDATSLMTNVPDIDGLERLSDVQFQLFGISAEKQTQLRNLLEQRRRGYHHDSLPFKSPFRHTQQYRAPPGLSENHDEPPTLFGGSPNRRGVPPPMIFAQQYSTVSSTRYLYSHPFAYDENQNQLSLDEEESRIEAELQELGGKMIGSVLDF